jgi:hypothetical protein
VADDFAERYRDLLTGSYDCVDRIVLNAYYPLGIVRAGSGSGGGGGTAIRMTGWMTRT